MSGYCSDLPPLCKIHTSPEVWRHVPGYEGLYRVSNRGRVRSVAGRKKYGDGWRKMSKRLLKLCNNNGYPSVALADGRGGKRDFLVHYLVLIAFVGPKPQNADECRHFPDGDKQHNCVENLLWGTYQDQWADKVAQGKNNVGRLTGEDHNMAKLTEEEVTQIRQLYKPGKYGLVTWLARKFRVTKGTIYNVVNYKHWKHVT